MWHWLKTTFVLTFVVNCSLLVQADDVDVPVDHDGVAVLSKDNFASFLQPKDVVMVEFYAPWCGHCKSLAPEYKKASDTLQKEGVYLAKVDATKETELAQNYMVQGFPTLLVFKKGVKLEDYSGERSAEAIVAYMMKLSDPDWKPPPSAIVTLTSGNFSNFVKNEKMSLVFWYSPKCDHCKQIMPEYESAAQDLKEWGIKVSKVDATEEKDLAEKFGVDGWPKFKLFREGRVFDYKGSPEKANIVAYMREQHRSPSEEKSNVFAIKNHMDRNEATVIGFFESKSSDLFEEFMAAANEMRGTLRFMHTFDKSAAKEFGVEVDTVSVFLPEIFSSPNEDKVKSLTKKSATAKEIDTFIRKNSAPLVGQRTKRNLFKYAERPLVVVYYDVNYDHQYVKDTQHIRDKVVEVAKKYGSSGLKFAISSDEEFESEIKTFGFAESNADVYVACFSEKQKFRMEVNEDEDFEAETLTKFVEDLLANKLSPYMKSQPVPQEQEGPVLEMVADNYDTEIHKVNKDAVVFFHAPWCGHCKEFKPVYEEIAKEVMAVNKNIVFAKMDATANDIPYMFPSIRGYPAIFFVKASDKFEPVQYSGDRSIDHVTEWISTNVGSFNSDNKAEIRSFTEETFVSKTKKDEL